MSKGITPLMRAVYYGKEEEVRSLMTHVNLNDVSAKGSSALMIACAGGHRNISQELLNEGARYDLCDHDNLSCWDHARQNNHVSIAEWEEDYSPTMGYLWMLRERIKECHECSLSRTRKQTVLGEGNGSSGVMFIGEGPGEVEDNSGRPFVGAAGRLLTKMIEKGAELKRRDVYIANIVKCRPPGNRIPTEEEAKACRGYLDEQIAHIKPRLLVALGATALKYLLGREVKITRERGMIFVYNTIPLLATYHPSYLLRNPESKKESYQDMLRIKTLVINNFTLK